MNRRFLLSLLTGEICFSVALAKVDKPNILIAISDDQSFPHASAYGCPWVNTPGFDWIAQNGRLFYNAFVTSPGSSPSRASMLTGLYPWQMEEAGTHASSFPLKYRCFPDELAEAGYLIGYTGKGWGPGNWKISGRKHNPAGPEYNEFRLKPPFSGISDIDYAENFKHFLRNRKEGQPFYFWLGAREPHRSYETDSWKEAGKDIDGVIAPPFLPDKISIKEDLLDYAVEIEWFDCHLQRAIEILKEEGELENTIIIVTSDNGMPFPSAKANCYEYGIHVPLAIYWFGKIKEGEVCDEIVSLVDLAPFVLKAAGIQRDEQKKGGSFSFPEEENSIAVAGRERHSSARYNNEGYPIRALRTERFLYIRNYTPDRWPAGDPCSIDGNGNLTPMHSAYFDIDGNCRSWEFIVANRDTFDIYPFFLKATVKRPYEELYDIKSDKGCLHNLVGNNLYQDDLLWLRSKMDSILKQTQDLRFICPESKIWDDYPRLDGAIRSFPKPLK